MSRLLSLIIALSISPLLFIISLLIVVENGRPILFKQKRVGKGNELFWIYKFRTMKKNTPNIPTHLLKDSSNYYTKVGPFLRKYSLDELPQLINIMKGDISFIGPRPALYNQKDLIQKREKKGVHMLKPGVTGWAQVNGRDGVSIAEKVELDYYYMQNKSFFLNLKIMFITLSKVIKAENVQI
tara:strand:- start:442 stop:990 length:549 start_codon:yes stop_codon:yes gene_type:complete